MRNSGAAMTISPDKLLTSLRWRYATKQFDPARKIPAATWDAIEESMVLTPSSFGLQPWKFLVIQDPGIRALLSPESWKQPQVTEASHYVVLTSRTDLDASDIDAWMARMAEVRGGDSETTAPLRGMIRGFAQAMSHEERHAWNIRQSYIALGQLMTSAAMLGIDACPMEGISAAGYDHVLGLEGSGYATVVACALGYRSADDKYAEITKVRFDRSRVITHL
jgi:nitroreductase